MKHLCIVGLVAGFAGLVVTARAGRLEIDPQQSRIEVAVSCTIDSFTAHLEKYQAVVDCDPAVALPARADVSFNFADLKTGNPDRDRAMLKWLEYDTNQMAAFHLTGWSQAGTTNLALGGLTLHGVTRAVQMPVTVRQDAAGWEVSGRAVVDYRDFKLPKIRKALLLTVDPALTVTFHLAGKIAAAK